MAGVSRLQYTTDIRLIRTMCSGRVDLDHVLRAFSNGSDAVFIGGCRLNECNYITHGNYDALNMVLLCKRIMEHLGLNPDRLRIQFASSAEGNLFAEVTVLHGGDTVRDDDAGALAHDPAQALEDLGLGVGVHGRESVVEDQDARVLRDGAGD